jgi:mannosyltransferase
MTGTLTRPGRWRGHPSGTSLPARSRMAQTAGALRRVIGAVWIWPMLVTAVIGGHGITAAVMWRDELATWQAASRSVAQLWHMVHNVDAVLGVYYLGMHFWMALFGDSPAAMRAPSLIAMTGTAGLVALAGRRLGGPTAGLAAGLVFAVIPSVSRFAEEARPYALVMFFTALATLLLLRALERPSWARWALYALAVAAAGAFNVLALCLLTGHALGAAIRCWRPAKDSVGGRREIAFGFCLAALAGVTLDLPVMIAGHRQTAEQIGGLARPALSQLLGQSGTVRLWPELFYSTAVAVAVLVFAAASLRGPSLRASAYSLATAFVPIAVLWAASQGTVSYWYIRYLMFTVPAWAVAAGLGIAGMEPGSAAARRARGIGVAAIVALIAILGIPDQHAIRQAEAHNWWSYPDTVGDYPANYTGAAKVIAEHERPGDGIVFKRDDRWMVDIGVDYYLRGRAKPADVFLIKTPAQAGRLTAVECAHPARCLRGEPRLWVVYQGNERDPYAAIEPAKAAALHAARYATQRVYAEDGLTVALMTRE